MYQRVWKRALDILLSGVGLIILAIPMCVVALVIRREDPGPAMFRQKRVGAGKKLFTLYKFRSMKLSAPKDVPTHLLRNPEQYYLRCGRVIRKYSIDELPQLLNILKGDMSVIGPRPPIKAKFDGEYVQKLSFAFDCRCFFGTIGKVLRGDDVADGAQEKEDQEATGGRE